MTWRERALAPGVDRGDRGVLEESIMAIAVTVLQRR
jgi:hypothetical protein